MKNTNSQFYLSLVIITVTHISTALQLSISFQLQHSWCNMLMLSINIHNPKRRWTLLNVPFLNFHNACITLDIAALIHSHGKGVVQICRNHIKKLLDRYERWKNYIKNKSPQNIWSTAIWKDPYLSTNCWSFIINHHSDKHMSNRVLQCVKMMFIMINVG